MLIFYNIIKTTEGTEHTEMKASDSINPYLCALCVLCG